MPDNEKHLDPSVNVREMLNVVVLHQDKLRDVEIRHVEELARLREKHTEDKFRDADVKYQIQFNAAKDAVSIASVAQEKAMAAALEGTKDAINKADVNTDKRFGSISEKIDGLASTLSKNSGAQGIYVTHMDLQQSLDKLQSNIELSLKPLLAFMNSQGGTSKGRSDMAGWIVGGIATLISIGSFIAMLLK